MREQLDKIDLEIIRLLQNDGRTASSEIAKTTGIPEATIRYRLKKLIDKKFIQIVAAANPIKLGFGIAACISIDAEIKQVNHVIRKLVWKLRPILKPSMNFMIYFPRLK
jgi:Lrp/AsnC family transcriptional regulator for asnA, asnC and gidA